MWPCHIVSTSGLLATAQTATPALLHFIRTISRRVQRRTLYVRCSLREFRKPNANCTCTPSYFEQERHLPSSPWAYEDALASVPGRHFPSHRHGPSHVHPTPPAGCYTATNISSYQVAHTTSMTDEHKHASLHSMSHARAEQG